MKTLFAILRTCARRALGPMAALSKDVAGTAAIEFVFVIPFLLLGAIGCFDYSIGIYRQMQVESAAQAGAQYAVLHGYDSYLISHAVTGATSYTAVTASPAPTQYCGCASGTAVVAATCGSPCANGVDAGTYVTVSASATYATLVSYPGIAANFPLVGRATVRLQ